MPLDSIHVGRYTPGMPKRSSKRKKKRPADVNRLAKSIVDDATNEQPEQQSNGESGKNPAAVALGRLGGLKGGKARAKKLSARRRRDIARKAAAVRWKNTQ